MSAIEHETCSFVLPMHIVVGEGEISNVDISYCRGQEVSAKEIPITLRQGEYRRSMVFKKFGLSGSSAGGYSGGQRYSGKIRS